MREYLKVIILVAKGRLATVVLYILNVGLFMYYQGLAGLVIVRHKGGLKGKYDWLL